MDLESCAISCKSVTSSIMLHCLLFTKSAPVCIIIWSTFTIVMNISSAVDPDLLSFPLVDPDPGGNIEEEKQNKCLELLIAFFKLKNKFN